jgi:hypothetical protein
VEQVDLDELDDE